MYGRRQPTVTIPTSFAYLMAEKRKTRATVLLFAGWATQSTNIKASTRPLVWNKIVLSRISPNNRNRRPLFCVSIALSFVLRLVSTVPTSSFSRSVLTRAETVNIETTLLTCCSRSEPNRDITSLFNETRQSSWLATHKETKTPRISIVTAVTVLQRPTTQPTASQPIRTGMLPFTKGHTVDVGSSPISTSPVSPVAGKRISTHTTVTFLPLIYCTRRTTLCAPHREEVVVDRRVRKCYPTTKCLRDN